MINIQIFIAILICILTALTHSEHISINKTKCSIVLPRDDDVQLLYYQITRPDAVIHYIWSLVGSPTLYMSITDPINYYQYNCDNINNTIDWNTFPNSGSADLPGVNGSFAFSLVFTKLYEYRDKGYTAAEGFDPRNLHNTSTYRDMPLSDLEWKFDSHSQVLQATTYNVSDNFTWCISINVPDDNGRLSNFPKTLFTENSTTFDFVFEKFNYKISTDHSDGMTTKYGRLIIEMTMIHGPLSNGTINETFSLDDEYTPSIFRTYTYLFGKPGIHQGYLQWKPISYLSADRKSTSSQQVTYVPADLYNNETLILPYGLPTALYKSDDTIGNITTAYLVMGTESDDNNGNPEYVTWTAILGYGKVPYDQISWTVIITIIVGLGVPALFVILGGVYVVIKKKPWKKFVKANGYSKINSDEE